jgi:hypothetical protein
LNFGSRSRKESAMGLLFSERKRSHLKLSVLIVETRSELRCDRELEGILVLF